MFVRSDNKNIYTTITNNLTNIIQLPSIWSSISKSYTNYEIISSLNTGGQKTNIIITLIKSLSETLLYKNYNSNWKEIYKFPLKIHKSQEGEIVYEYTLTTSIILPINLNITNLISSKKINSGIFAIGNAVLYSPNSGTSFYNLFVLSSNDEIITSFTSSKR